MLVDILTRKGKKKWGKKRYANAKFNFMTKNVYKITYINLKSIKCIQQWKKKCKEAKGKKKLTVFHSTQKIKC